MAKLTENSATIFNYIRDNDEGDGLSMQEIADGTGRTVKQIGPVVWTQLGKERGDRPQLVEYKKIEVEGEDKRVGYVFITEAGINYSEK